MYEYYLFLNYYYKLRKIISKYITTPDAEIGIVIPNRHCKINTHFSESLFIIIYKLVF